MYHLPYLGSTSDWLKQTFNQSKALRTQTCWVATPYQNGISLVVPQMSFQGETHGEMISAFSKVKKWEYQIIFPRLSRKAKRSKNKLQIQFPLSVSPNNNNNIILFKHDKITAVLYLKIKHSLQMNRKFKN